MTSMSSLEGEVALVAGASRGQGEESQCNWVRQGRRYTSRGERPDTSDRK